MEKCKKMTSNPCIILVLSNKFEQNFKVNFGFRLKFIKPYTYITKLL